jgi:hypothetical protein
VGEGIVGTVKDSNVAVVNGDWSSVKINEGVVITKSVIGRRV